MSERAICADSWVDGTGTVHDMESNQQRSSGEGADAYREQLELAHRELAVLTREHRRLRREHQDAVQRLRAAIAERDAAYGQLREVILTCLGCSRVEDGAAWVTVTEFLRARAPFLSHGFCPDCAERELGELERQALTDRTPRSRPGDST